MTHVPENKLAVKVPVEGWSQSCARCCDANHKADWPTLEPATNQSMTDTSTTNIPLIPGCAGHSPCLQALQSTLK